MPRKSKRPCRYRGCPNLVDNDSGYCAEHASLAQKEYDKYIRSPEHNKRYGYRWRLIRARILELRPLCENCKKKGIYTASTEVHHIKPLAEGGTHDIINLMALCRSCHAQIHNSLKGSG